MTKTIAEIANEARKKVAKWPKWKRNIRVTKYSTGFNNEEENAMEEQGAKIWQGTVLGDEGIDIDWTDNEGNPTDKVLLTRSELYALREAQAGITGPIAEKAGMQKAIDWVKENGKEIQCLFEDRIGEIAIDYAKWRAFLKEVEK